MDVRRDFHRSYDQGARLLALVLVLAIVLVGVVVLGATDGPVATPDVVIAPAPSAATVELQPAGGTHL